MRACVLAALRHAWPIDDAKLAASYITPAMSFPAGPHELSRLDYGSVTGFSSAAALAALDANGFVVIENAVPAAVCDATVAEMQLHIDATPAGHLGLGATRRVGALVARSPSSHQMVAHPAVLALVHSVLAEQRLTGCEVHLPPESPPRPGETEAERGYVGEGDSAIRDPHGRRLAYSFQLHNTQIIDIQPGGVTFCLLLFCSCWLRWVNSAALGRGCQAPPCQCAVGPRFLRLQIGPAGGGDVCTDRVYHRKRRHARSAGFTQRGAVALFTRSQFLPRRLAGLQPAHNASHHAKGERTCLDWVVNTRRGGESEPRSADWPQCQLQPRFSCAGNLCYQCTDRRYYRCRWGWSAIVL
jgi:hypothetical protein